MKPPWPFRLPRRGGGDGVMRSRGGVVTRLLHIDERPIVVNVWQRREGTVRFRAAGEAGEEALELAISRMRFALSVDEDLRPFYDEFRSDPVLGPAIRRHPHLRPHRRPWPWEALAAAITAQLIESSRALQIQRQMVRRWGRKRSAGGGDGISLRDAPAVEAIAGLAPAELAACDLAPKRAIALIRCAREVSAGRIDLTDSADDHRLLAITDIGPWTVQCLGLDGRGEDDSLPAGDLAYVKLVGRLAGLGRRAEIEEIDDYFARYEPYRGLAGYFLTVHYHHAVQTGPPLRLAA